jgi:hypothetical protein
MDLAVAEAMSGVATSCPPLACGLNGGYAIAATIAAMPKENKASAQAMAPGAGGTKAVGLAVLLRGQPIAKPVGKDKRKVAEKEPAAATAELKAGKRAAPSAVGRSAKPAAAPPSSAAHLPEKSATSAAVKRSPKGGPSSLMSRSSTLGSTSASAALTVDDLDDHALLAVKNLLFLTKAQKARRADLEAAEKAHRAELEAAVKAQRWAEQVSELAEGSCCFLNDHVE